MSFANERAGSLKFLANGVDRLTVYSSGGAYLGNAASDPGAFNLKVQAAVGANKLIFDTATPGTLVNPGEVVWNVDEETLDLQLDGFVVHTGQHLIYHAQNSTGATIAKGAPVMFAGTNGGSGKLLIKPWDGTGPATLFMGIAGEEFVDGHQGSVVAFGKVRDIQTDGDNYGQTWTAESIIYAGTTAGTLTNVKPSAPNPIVEVMAVIRAHATAGIVFVRPNYFTADVFGPSSVADNAIARFDGTTGKLIQTGGITIADGATGTLSGTNSGDVTLAGTPAYLTIANQVITRNQVNLTAASAHVTGILPVANGGTGQTALSSIDAADFGSGDAADNYVLTADGAGGAAWEAASGGGGGEYAITDANFVDSIGTLAAVPGMFFSIAGGETVTAIFSGYWQTGAANYGFKYDFTGPASPTFVNYSEYAFTALAAARTVGTSVSAFETLKEQSAATIGSPFPITIQITVTASSGNGGTVALRMAGEASAATFTLLRGFTMQVMRV
jgi:hypothetical protein